MNNNILITLGDSFRELLYKLAMGANPNQKIENYSVLSLFCLKNLLPHVKLLVKYGANINDNYAIELASSDGNFEMVKYLISNGCSCTDNFAIKYAKQNGYIEIFQYLIANSAKSIQY